MVDTLSPEERSRVMSRIRGRDTVPELVVRRAVFAMGYRYRLHGAGLPGRPDLVFPGKRKVIFVHGCFWHQHPGCPFAYRPKSREAFWAAKLAGNRERDEVNLVRLSELGWQTLVIWECELGAVVELRERVREFLERS